MSHAGMATSHSPVNMHQPPQSKNQGERLKSGGSGQQTKASQLY